MPAKRARPLRKKPAGQDIESMFACTPRPAGNMYTEGPGHHCSGCRRSWPARDPTTPWGGICDICPGQ
eukprot:4184885-Karenia_brevis.AAC.1